MNAFRVKARELPSLSRGNNASLLYSSHSALCSMAKDYLGLQIIQEHLGNTAQLGHTLWAYFLRNQAYKRVMVKTPTQKAISN